MKELLKRLGQEFADAEYAHAYMESHAVSRLAAQIFALRKQRGWSQAQLAEKSGVAQERISKIESADFTSLTMKTLQKFSRAFDVNLSVVFNTFSAGMLDIANLSTEGLKVVNRSADLAAFTKMNLMQNGRGEYLAYKSLAESNVKTVVSLLPVDIVTSSGKWQVIKTNKVQCEKQRVGIC